MFLIIYNSIYVYIIPGCCIRQDEIRFRSNFQSFLGAMSIAHRFLDQIDSDGDDDDDDDDDGDDDDD